MVDRPNPYSLQPNFIPTVLPQQLPPHLQQSQTQLPDIASKANTDFMRTMSMLHREWTGTDMQPAQFKHLAQMFRNQTAVACQPMVGQHFGMAAPGQPSPFHEQQQAQPQISNFPNAGMQNSQLAYHNRMFQPFPHQMRPDVMTQLQGQLIQNGNMPPQLTPPSASMVHPGAAGMFAPSDASHHTHVAPAHGALVTSQMPQNVQAPLAPQRPSYLDLKERIQQEELTISMMRQAIFHLTQNSNGIPEAESMRKAEPLFIEVNNRTAYLNRLIYLAQHQAQGNTVSNLLGGPSTWQLTPTQNAQNSTDWMSQPVPQASQGIATPQMPPGAPPQPSMQANLSTLQPPQNPLVDPSTPPRSGLPSHQPFGTQASPPMANNSPFTLSGGQPPAPNLSAPYQVPSLSKEIFHARYENWCNSRNIVRDQRLMSIDGRPIDLHALHVLVMRAGGLQKARNLWPIIGGHMGFVQFPPHDHQPTRSSPAAAQHLAAVYEKYLVNFDSAYIHTFLEMKQKAQAAQPQSTAMNGAGNADRAALASRQLQQLIPFANLSPAGLRASKLPESAIRFVEAYRTRLQQIAGALSRNPDGVIGVQPQQAPAPVQFPNAHHSQIPLPSNMGPRPVSQVPVQCFAPGEPERNGTLLAPPSNANVQSQTRITMQQAESTIRRLREESLAQIPVPPHLLPEEQKADLIEVVEQLNAYVMKLEPKLATWYAIVKSEDRLKTILQWFSKIQQQRSLLQAGQSRFVQSLHQFRAMIPQMVSLENAMRTINVPITPESSGNPLMTSPVSPSRPSDTPAPQDPPVSRQPSNTHPVPKKKQSVYTLAAVHPPTTSASFVLDPPLSARSPLISPANRNYGSTRRSGDRSLQSSPLLRAALKMAAVFLVSTILLGGTLWLALPVLDERDRPHLQVPKSFTQLQELNALLKKYRDIYPYRIVVCYVTVYLFLQAFSLPGSMYLSILGGAVWGVPRALPLACTCVATGASLCYLISAALGPALLTLPKWKARFDKWSDALHAQKDNIISFLIVIRIAPLPPHWVINVLCPHVNIGLVPFWITTWLGIMGVTVIHTTIGGGLDEMTSADDFHLISWRNFLGLSAVVVGVLIPVGLRYYLKRDVAVMADIEQADEDLRSQELGEDAVLALSLRDPSPKAKNPLARMSMDDELDEFLDSASSSGDSDIILESGPVLITKPDEE